MSWEYIDEYMTLPRLEAISKYWSQSPPVNELFASFLGYKGPEKAGTMESLLEQFGIDPNTVGGVELKV